MNKRIINMAVSLALSIALIASTLVFTINADTSNTDEWNFSFDTSADIASSVGYGGVIKPDVAKDGELSVLKTDTKNGGSSRAAFPLTLESGKTYEYKIRYRVDTTATKGTFMYLYGATTESSCGYNKDNVLVKVIAGGSVSNTEYSEFVGEFTPTAENVAEPHNYLGLFLQSENTQTFFIDFVNIKIKKAPEEVESKNTLNFDSDSDILSSVGYGGVKKPAAEKDGETTVLTVGSKSGGQARVTFPTKLEPNKTYEYKIKYRVDTAATKGSFMYLYGATTESSCGYDKNNVLAKVVAGGSVSNTEYSEFVGEFTTTAENVAEPHNYLGLFLQSESTQTFFIDSISVNVKIAPVDNITLEFDKNTDVSVSYGYGSVGKPSVSKDGEKTVLKMDSKLNGQARVTLPIMLEAEKTYEYEIKYRVDSKATKGTFMYLFGATAESSCGYDKNNVLAKVVAGGSVSNTEYSEFIGEFKTTLQNAAEPHNYLGIFLQSENTQTFFIDSITIKVKADEPDDEPIQYISEGTLEFDAKQDICASYGSNISKPSIAADGTKTVLSISSKENAQARASTRFRLKPGKTYEYKLTYRVTGPAQYGTFLYLYGATGEGDCGYNKENVLDKVIAGGTVNNTEYAELTGEFKTTDSNVAEPHNLLGIFLQSINTQTFYIDSLTISEVNKEPVEFIPEGTLEFESNKDICGSIGYQIARPYIGGDADKMVLIMGSKINTSQAVSLPIKLENGKTYEYRIKYRVNTTGTKGTFMYLFGATEDKTCGYQKVNVLSKALAGGSVSNTEYSELKGKFTTGSNVDEPHNLLGIFLQSENEQTFYIDSVSIKIVPTVIRREAIGEGTLEFDEANELDAAESGPGTSNAELTRDGGDGVLYIPSNSSGISVRLPIKLTAGRTYHASIKYRVCGVQDLDGMNGWTYLSLVSGNSSEENFFNCDSKYTLTKIFNWSELSKSNKYEEIVVSFKTTTDNVDDIYNYLCLRFKGVAALYISSITIDSEKTETFGPLVNYGKLDFNTYNQLDMVSSNGAAIIQDGNRKVLALYAMKDVNIRLPIKVQNGKQISFTMKAKVVSNGNSDWFRGNTYWAFMLGDGKTKNINSFINIKSNDSIIKILYNFKKLTPTEDYEEIRGRVGVIKNAKDGMDYLCIRYKGDATIYIDEIEFRDGSNDIYGDPIDDTTWKLPDEPDSEFTLWKNWLTNLKHETLSADGNTAGNAKDTRGNDTEKRNMLPWFICIGAVVLLGGISVPIVLVTKKKKKG